MPLNALSRDDLKVAFDWTIEKLKDTARYYNRFLWRSFPFSEYKKQIPDEVGDYLNLELLEGAST